MCLYNTKPWDGPDEVKGWKEFRDVGENVVIALWADTRVPTGKWINVKDFPPSDRAIEENLSIVDYEPGFHFYTETQTSWPCLKIKARKIRLSGEDYFGVHCAVADEIFIFPESEQ